MTFEHVRPLIVPREYARVGLPAALEPLGAPDLLLAWVELAPGQSMLYVTPERAAQWDRAAPGWRPAAVASMRADGGEPAWTHEKRDEAGALLWVAMMHDDGLGSSRLLLAEDLARAFPEGYWAALPDRSCGLAVSRRAGAAALDGVREMVRGMHAGATTPMVAELREPADLVPRAV